MKNLQAFSNTNARLSLFVQSSLAEIRKKKILILMKVELSERIDEIM